MGPVKIKQTYREKIEVSILETIKLVCRQKKDRKKPRCR